jgi:hypothetical protein
VIGDDSTVAALIVTLLATLSLVQADAPAWPLPLVVLGATARGLLAAVLRERP